MKRKVIISKANQISSAGTIGTYLRDIREAKGISLTSVAEQLGYTKGYISSIETGQRRLPRNSDFIQRYAASLDLSPEELYALNRQSGTSGVEPSNIPYKRNDFFTGRELEIKQIYNHLINSSTLPHVCAITGISGIGKTSVAVEYAFRYASEYQFTLWVQADTPDILSANLAQLANFLDLPEKSAQDRRTTIAVVKHWLQENSRCLLILDNIDEFSIEDDFLSQFGRNHLILTTRTQLLGNTVHNIELKQISEEDGTLLLLRQSQHLSNKTELDKVSDILKVPAQQITVALSGLPFALNQAANYIAETQCGLGYYLKLLEMEQMKLLEEESSPATRATIATWRLSFQKIKDANPAAAELLSLCAFLYPDMIYRELLLDGSPTFPPQLKSISSNPLKLNQAIRELLRYSLVQSDLRSGALSMHRLVQVIVRDILPLNIQRQWVEATVKIVNLAFPLIEVATWPTTWPKCQLYFHQARACADLIAQWKITSNESRQLLSKLGKYLGERTEFKKAEQMYQLALELDKLAGAENAILVMDLYRLAQFYQRQGKYDRAEEYYKRSIQLLKTEEIIENYQNLFRSYIDLLKSQNNLEEAQNIQDLAGVESLEKKTRSQRRVVINDDNEDINYSGVWVHSSRRWGDYGNDAHVSNDKGASFKYSFTGYGVEIISNLSTFQGEIDVSLDGEHIQTIHSSYFYDRQGQISQTIVFNDLTLEHGDHTIEVRLENGTFALDALAFFVDD